jgi:Recombination endonuclease VII
MLCTKCKQDKDVSLFHKDKKKVSGYTSWCKECRNTARADIYWKDPEHGRNRAKSYRESLTAEQRYISNRNTKLKQAYGLTHEQVEEMKRLQDYKCYVCNKQESEAGTKGLVVDHNHTTGQIRKMLCGPCNTALGLLNEDVGIFTSLIKYVEEHNG